MVIIRHLGLKSFYTTRMAKNLQGPRNLYTVVSIEFLQQIAQMTECTFLVDIFKNAYLLL